MTKEIYSADDSAALFPEECSMNDTFVLPGCHRNTSETVTQQWHCWLCCINSSAMPKTNTHHSPYDAGAWSRQHLPLLHSQVSSAGSALRSQQANLHMWVNLANKIKEISNAQHSAFTENWKLSFQLNLHRIMLPLEVSRQTKKICPDGEKVTVLAAVDFVRDFSRRQLSKQA